MTWELSSSDGNYTVIKIGEDNLVFDKVDLPSPQKKYSIETNSDGVSYLKDGDKFLKSCDDTMHEILDKILEGRIANRGLILKLKYLKSQLKKQVILFACCMRFLIWQGRGGCQVSIFLVADVEYKQSTNAVLNFQSQITLKKETTSYGKLNV